MKMNIATEHPKQKIEIANEMRMKVQKRCKIVHFDIETNKLTDATFLNSCLATNYHHIH